MRTIIQNITHTKNQVKQLVGTNVRLKINRGRNRIEFIDGEIEAVYPQIFTIRNEKGDLNSFSYSDILANNITFYRCAK
ncbi:MAG: Veg family protein [Clostridia bacterium]